ncbi:MAG: hypothetical protein ACOYYI_00585 [Chloroflexota bacterium]
MNRSATLNSLQMFRRVALQRGLVFGLLILSALLAFEVFNYSSTFFALRDIIGDLAVGPFRWATVLAFAFCAIDFAGIARIFTPEKGANEPAEVWYLLGAWFLAAAFNAALTWWGISVAIMKHTAEGGVLVGQATMTKVIPILVAVMVLTIRVLLINTFSIAGERIFSLAEDGQYSNRPAYRPAENDTYRAPAGSFPRPAPKPAATVNRPAYAEPTYHPIGMNAEAQNNNRFMS